MRSIKTMRKHLGFIVLVTIVLWVGKREIRSSKSFYRALSYNYVKASRWWRSNETVNSSIISVKCRKPKSATNFTVCDGLPYTNTFCGSTEQDSLVVPNIVHYVWLGDNSTLKFYHYLSLRSASSIQKPSEIIFHINSTEPRGVWWERAKSEIPCLRTQIVESPTSIYGNEVDYVIHQTDIVRNFILLRYGGIYLDSDAIVLKSLNPLRKYKFTIGRSTEKSLSNGVMLAEKHSHFIQAWTDLYKTFNKEEIKGTKEAEFAIKVPFKLHLARPGLACHIEETSMQRPNPWIDGRASISHGQFDISKNYILHLHPSKSLKRDPTVLLEYTPDDVRLFDTTYGAGARMALFGIEDLIFLPSEQDIMKNRLPTEKVKKFKPVHTYKPEPNWPPNH